MIQKDIIINVTFGARSLRSQAPSVTFKPGCVPLKGCPKSDSSKKVASFRSSNSTRFKTIISFSFVRNMSTKEATKRLRALRSCRCYWMHQLDDVNITCERRDKCENKIEEICREIAYITKCPVEHVYKSLNKGHCGRPRKSN